MRPYAGPVGYGDTADYAHSSTGPTCNRSSAATRATPPSSCGSPSEPEASVCLPGYSGAGCYGHDTCPADATTTLVNWFDRVGAEVHALDPGVPVETGELTSQQCGWSGMGELRIDQAAGVDVASFHDYGSDSVAMPATGRRHRRCQAGGQAVGGRRGRDPCWQCLSSIITARAAIRN